MKKNKKVDSREVGLAAGLIFSRELLKTDNLHYGYWTDDLEVNLLNVPKAQENYSKFLISHIPEGTKTILDVGCGTGVLAGKLIEMGYAVDCVSPSLVLTEEARARLGNGVTIFETRYEQLKTEKMYDLVVFSESYQYVTMDEALENTVSNLNDGGHLLICDFFRTEAEGDSPMGGGHHLSRFYDLVSEFPFKSIKNIDITAMTAPTMKIANDMLMKLGMPLWKLIFYYMDSNRPLLSRFLKWKYHGKIEKINRKYFSNRKNAENFSIYKTYRLLLYKKEGAVQ